MPIRQLTVGSTPVKLLNAGPRASVQLISLPDNADTIRFDTSGNQAFRDLTETSADNRQSASFNASVGSPLDPGGDVMLRGDAVKNEIWAVSTGANAVISVVEYHDEGTVEIS